MLLQVLQGKNALVRSVKFFKKKLF